MFGGKKDKAQIKGDFDPACTQADTSDCDPMDGNIKVCRSFSEDYLIVCLTSLC